jgi:hypothetical protein
MEANHAFHTIGCQPLPGIKTSGPGLVDETSILPLKLIRFPFILDIQVKKKRAVLFPTRTSGNQDMDIRNKLKIPQLVRV